ncbi:hypothetical protein [Streptomyces avicenniae]|uniref:hypothetical protein n=1 Tax=Streptomyces avicenniae TaxID=500153 RepID=UPI00069B3219|nr:hypothetical protein [Streptomyces avicenniae]
MGFDTSFHPVDLPLVQGRLLPYIAGQGPDDALDDLLARAAATRRTGFRAKQWALKAFEAASEQDIDAFDAQLYVWGRPFLVTGDDPAAVTAGVLRWIGTPYEAADELARETLAALHPGLADVPAPPRDEVPSEAELRREISYRVRVLRAAVAALRAGKDTVRDPESGETYPPTGLVEREIPMAVVAFSAALVPGWMSRGYTWPSTLCERAGTSTAEFSAPTELLAPLWDEFPDLTWFAPPTIVENDMVGGLVAAADVPALRARLRAERPALVAPAERDGWGEGCAFELDRIDEALALAGHLGFAFCEATEIYSGFSGALN